MKKLTPEENEQLAKDIQESLDKLEQLEKERQKIEAGV